MILTRTLLKRRKAEIIISILNGSSKRVEVWLKLRVKLLRQISNPTGNLTRRS